ncbi:MAG: DUF3108 domain-containing protein [Burkholderiales bacterium]|nr:DUF3108 domain-containing protein [Burkholderiales bacterium]
MVAVRPKAHGAAEPLEFELASRLARRRAWLATPKQRFALALLASLALHLLVATVVDFEPPERRVEPLVTRLMPPPPPPTASPSPPRPAPRRARPAVRPSEAVAAVVPAPQPEDVPEVPPVDPPPATPPVVETQPELPPVEAPAAQPAPVPPAPQPVEPTVAEPRPQAPAEPPARLPPRRLDLGYLAYLGEQRFEVGPVTLSFQHEDGRYSLRASGRARGLAALMYPGTFTGESRGRITGDGLKPERFVEERGRPDHRREVVFDYSERVIRLPEKEPLEMKDRTHDPLTWIVQFYFALPKSDRATFTVASTRRLDEFTLTRERDEELTVPVGDPDPLTGERRTQTVKTQVWKSVRQPDAEGKGGGTATFWLAPEFHYIPFKVKLVSASGRSASFELTGIKAE